MEALISSRLELLVLRIMSLLLLVGLDRLSPTAGPQILIALLAAVADPFVMFRRKLRGTREGALFQVAAEASKPVLVLLLAVTGPQVAAEASNEAGLKSMEEDLG